MYGASRKTLSKDKEPLEARRMQSRRSRKGYHLHAHPHGDDMLSARDVDVDRSPTRTDRSDQSRRLVDQQRVTWSRSGD